jgi:2-iminoacetate synthase
MTTQLSPPLRVLAEWIEATDQRAPHRLALLGRLQRIVSGDEQARPEQRQELATRLEQWRYQYLDTHGGAPNPRGLRLSEVLDLAVNQLAGRESRQPRWPRHALQDTSRDTDALARAAAALEPGVPLDEVVHQATALTCEHFSVASAAEPNQRRRMLLYAPIYLSSYCINHCAYCGFRHPNRIERRHLKIDDALQQAQILSSRGFRHILLVAGDFPRLTTIDYYTSIIRALSQRGICVAIEIAPQSVAAYEAMVAAGARAVTLYQETYNEELYAVYHPRGSKMSYDWRLEGLERAAEAGIGRLGLGVLLGLANPREDLLAMVRHACYLQSRFPNRTLAFSLPRIREAPAGFEPPYTIDDELFVRLYCALRLAFPRAELVLSTRENEPLRNRLARICITQISAGSSTVPGGYEDKTAEQTYAGQFPVIDHRSPAAMAQWLREAGFEVTWDLAAN